MNSVPATLPERLVAAFAGFGPAYLRWVEERMRSRGVSFARGRLLGVLTIRSPRTMSELAAEVGTTRHNVTVLVDALEREGLVRRRAHPTDRRVTYVEATGAGAELCATALPEGIAAVADLFEALDEAEQAELLRLIEKLRRELSRRDEE